MLNSFLRFWTIFTLATGSMFGTVMAAEYGTMSQARMMLDRAVEAIKADKNGAIDKFNFNDEQFRDRDLFVFCFNGQDGKYTAHEAMVGRDVRAFRDAKGQPYGQQMFDIATDHKIHTVTYLSPIPGSTELSVKRAYLTRVGDQVCGVSAYQTPTMHKARVKMETFYMFLTLSSPAAPQALFISQPKSWKDELECERALPKMEGALTRLIRYDASALELFGTMNGGPLKPGYFVSTAGCQSAEPIP
jgi:hypothetical protein